MKHPNNGPCRSALAAKFILILFFPIMKCADQTISHRDARSLAALHSGKLDLISLMVALESSVLHSGLYLMNYLASSTKIL